MVSGGGYNTAGDIKVGMFVLSLHEVAILLLLISAIFSLLLPEFSMGYFLTIYPVAM